MYSPEVARFFDIEQAVRSRYPPWVVTNLDLLYRMAWTWMRRERSPESILPRVRRFIASRYLLEWKSLARSCSLGHHRFTEVDILFSIAPWVPRRMDLVKKYVVPIARRLAEMDVRVGLCVSHRSRGCAMRFFPACGMVCEDVSSKEAYRDAKDRMKKARDIIEGLCADLSLDSVQRDYTYWFFRRFFYDLEVFSVMLRDLKPKAVVTFHYMHRPGQAWAIAETQAAGQRLSSVVLQHGALLPDPLGVWLFGARNVFGRADCIVVWSRYFENLVKAVDVLAGKRVMIGGYVANTNEASNDILRTAGAGTLLLVLTGAGDGWAVTYERLLDMVFDAIKSSSSRWHVIIRPHPLADLPWSKWPLADGVSAEVVAPRRESLEQTVKRSDVVVGMMSTGLLEAALCGKPVIYLATTESDAELMRSTGIVTVRDREELRYHLERISQSRENYIELAKESREIAEFLLNTRGAAERTVNHLLGLLEA